MLVNDQLIEGATPDGNLSFLTISAMAEVEYSSIAESVWDGLA